MPHSIGWQVLTCSDREHDPGRIDIFEVYCNGTFDIVGDHESVLLFQKTAGPAFVFTLSAGFALLGFLVTLLFLKNRQPDTPPEEKKRFLETMGIVKKRLPLKASYLVGFVTRADTPLIPALLPMWGVKVAAEHGMTAAEANQKLFMVALPILGVLSIIAFPLAGVLLDKIGRIKVILLCLLLLAVAYALLVIAPDPFAFWAIDND